MNMYYNSPTYGKVNLEKLQEIVSSYMAKDKKAQYEIVIGTDSQKTQKDTYDFVSALIIHHVGMGGIYFWNRKVFKRKISLKERIYQEATMSLEAAENFVAFFKENGISKYDIQIHVDIGKNGQTREMITEVVGMVRGSGYDVKIKPNSYGASKVADKYT
jgi:predicted RNase H-related nuclease YkuK (DUF458 family)